MRLSKNQYLLAGSALLGMATASTIWLSGTLQRGAVKQEAARAIGFRNAADMEEASELTDRLNQSFIASEGAAQIGKSDEEKVKRMFQEGNDTQKAFAMGIIDSLAEKSWKNPETHVKVLRLLEVTKKDNSPEFREWSLKTASKLPDRKGRPVMASLSSDPDPAVRRKARTLLNQQGG